MIQIVIVIQKSELGNGERSEQFYYIHINDV